MNGEQLRLLSKMKKLINQGFRKFADRKDRNYLQELLEIGISVDESWQEILTLNRNNYFFDHKPCYYKNNENTLTFKKIINNNLVYIKLKLETYNDNEYTVCLSFHIDYK